MISLDSVEVLLDIIAFLIPVLLKRNVYALAKTSIESKLVETLGPNNAGTTKRVTFHAYVV